MAYDLFVLAIIGLTMLRGAWKGIAWQLAGIAALVLCFAFATPLSQVIAPSIPLAPPLNRWAGMLAIYLVFSFGTFAVARQYRDWLEKSKFVEFDRYLGGGFGLIKGVLYCLVITFFLVGVSGKSREYIMHTKSGHAAAIIMDRLHPVMPVELHAILEPYIHQLDQPGQDLIGHHHDDEFYNDDPFGAGERPSRDVRDEDPFDTDWNNGFDDPDDFQNDPSPSSGYRPVEERPDHRRPPSPNEYPRPRPSRPVSNPDDYDSPPSQPAPARNGDDTVSDFWQQGSRDLISQLNSGLPDALRTIANAFDTSADSGRMPEEALEEMPAEEPFDDESGPDSLVADIADVLVSDPESHKAIVNDITAALAGVPKQAANAALEDWHADLLGENDPDPDTDLVTPLDERIARQLKRLGIPRNRVSRAVQERLDRAQPR